VTKLERIVANVWFSGEFSEEDARESSEQHDLNWSDIEAEYGRQYEEMERLSNGTH